MARETLAELRMKLKDSEKKTDEFGNSLSNSLAESQRLTAVVREQGDMLTRDSEVISDHTRRVLDRDKTLAESTANLEQQSKESSERFNALSLEHSGLKDKLASAQGNYDAAKHSCVQYFEDIRKLKVELTAAQESYRIVTAENERLGKACVSQNEMLSQKQKDVDLWAAEARRLGHRWYVRFWRWFLAN